MAETTIENLAQEVRQLRSIVSTHINNPHGHPTADGTVVNKIGHAADYGFVAQKQIAQALGWPTFVADDTNVFSLKPGYYRCNKPAGLPSGITTPARAWTIDVNYPLSANDLGLITATSDSAGKFTAIRDSQGNWRWLRYGDQHTFGTDLAATGSWYTILHFENKMEIHVHADLDTTIAPQNVKMFETGYSGSLWLPGWKSGKLDDALYVSGIGKSGSKYLPIQAWFGPSLTISNPNSDTINHVSADFRYDLERF